MATYREEYYRCLPRPPQVRTFLAAIKILRDDARDGRGLAVPGEVMDRLRWSIGAALKNVRRLLDDAGFPWLNDPSATAYFLTIDNASTDCY